MKDHDLMDELETSTSSQHDRVQGRRKHRPDRHSEERTAGPQVIARIPRLERNRDAVIAERSSRAQKHRLLGTKVSAWTIVGGVGFLIVAAVLSSLVSRTFQSKDDPGRAASHRPEVPAPDAPPAPRWAATVPSSELTAANSSSSKAVDSPSSATPSAGLSAARWGENLGNSTAMAPVVPPSANVPWPPVPGARSPEVLPGGALGSLPTNPPAMPQNGTWRTNYEEERFPVRGGLVNARPSASRDNQMVDPRPGYRYVPPPDYRQDYRNTAASESRPDYRAGLTGEPRSDYPPAPYDSRPDYRVADRPRYNEPPARSDDRRFDSPDYRRSQDYATASPRGRDAGGYLGREQPVGYETSGGASSRTGIAGSPARTSTAGPEWVSPPNWVTPPAWDSPIAPAAGQSAQTPTSAVPPYPVTGFPGPESWAIGNGPVGGQVPPPTADYAPARFEGGIERPSNRISYERTGSSIR